MISYKQRRKNLEDARSLVAYYHQDSKIAEQYRKVYASLKFSSANKARQTLVITSPGYKEGKTTTVVNLGASIAQLGEKVLLVDADLKKPTMHQIFKIENHIGLTNVLSGKNTFREAIQETSMGTMDILTSGFTPINSAKLLGSPAMKALMRNVQEAYDIVLFDTPPFIEVVDANILANQCDGVLLVARDGKTKADKVIETKQLLELSGTSVVGSILNDHA
ncbi:MAG TPA: CpsD/CapB family tyrosine-protein kinase [Bacillales bacterium]|nr:CpsD/CapB family tyrosine-protein kinase [Bacillales bacterium]